LKDLKISWTGRWQHNHWQTIRSAYGRAPYFEHFHQELESLFLKKHEYLIDFSTAVLSWLLHASGKQALITEGAGNEPVAADHTPAPYRQVFSDRLGFYPQVSILDKLLCAGPGSLHIT